MMAGLKAMLSVPVAVTLRIVRGKSYVVDTSERISPMLWRFAKTGPSVLFDHDEPEIFCCASRSKLENVGCHKLSVHQEADSRLTVLRT